jgi:beta-lactamase superfamily II metal-dependent hydrolase
MPPSLTVTLLDVGWGDSIFLHSIDSNEDHHFALIDSNDTARIQQSRIFLRRYFRRHNHYIGAINKPYFDFVMMSHDHSDHRSGLENIVKEFGTRDFWYPHTERTAGLGRLLDFAEREINKPNGDIQFHEAIEVGKPLPDFGDVKMSILWPPDGYDFDHATPNNTSIVMSLRLGKWYVMLTGDAEEDVWEEIADKIPSKTRFFKVPHHGSVNGTFDGQGNSDWFNHCSKWSRLGISCDIHGNFVFPDPSVIQLLDNGRRKHFRTDEHYHISFYTNGSEYKVKHSHY